MLYTEFICISNGTKFQADLIRCHRKEKNCSLMTNIKRSFLRANLLYLLTVLKKSPKNVTVLYFVTLLRYYTVQYYGYATM